MQFSLPALPYTLDALEPYISQETLEYHYGKHHATYVVNLNNLLPSGEFEGSSDLMDVIRKAPPGGIFNNAAQIWNHTFYFESLSRVSTLMKRAGLDEFAKVKTPDIWSTPRGGTKLAEAIVDKWGSFTDFQSAFTELSLKTFGSGWVWLVKKPSGELDIISTQNAETPITTKDIPLLTCDVWEHAYYIDYRNVRPKYVETFLASLVNWSFAETNFA